MMWGYHFGGPWEGLALLLSWILPILVIVLLVVLAVRLFRGGGRGYWGYPPQHPDSPEEILHRRFANGEIDVEEYERRMAALRAQRPPRP